MSEMSPIVPSIAEAAIVDLDRRMARALDQQRGLKLTGEELAVLAASGAYGTLRTAAGKILEEQARCRVAKPISIAEVNSFSGGTAKPMARSAPPIWPSSGTTRSDAGQSALQRAQATLKLGS